MGKIQDMGGEAVAPSIEFGTDGIRGEAYEKITVGLAESFGAATAEAMGTRVVLVGRDTRESGGDLSKAVMLGAAKAGATVIDCGELPTPAIAYLATLFPDASGIVITASHNKYTDNGLKAFMPDGSKPDEETTKRIEHLIKFSNDRKQPEQEGEIIRDRVERLRLAYEDYLVSSVDPDLLEGKRVVIDAAHGAASVVAVNVATRLGADVVAVASDPNGRNINEGCGATEPDFAKAAVDKYAADVGFTLDGDADRIMLVSESGRVLDGDRMMLVLAMAAQQKGELDANTVVGTDMSNMGAEAALRERGIGFVRAGVGDTQVYRAMQKLGATIGGEQSGHIILRRYAKTGDGMLAALQTMQALRELKMTLDEAADLMRDYPQVLLNTKLPAELSKEDKESLDGHPEVVAGVDGFYDELALRGLRGRVLLRPSGTEPKYRVMVEVEPGRNEEQTEAHDRYARATAGRLLQLVASAAQQ